MLSSADADGPFPRGHSRSAMKLSQSFHVHGIAPSRNRTKAPRSPVPRHANFSNTLSDAPRFRGRPFPRGHSRSAMKLSQIFRVHGIAPSRSRTKAPHSPVPRQLLKHPSRHPASRTALLRADTRASPRAILNLPQARHTSPRRLVMPATAGRRRFHWRPFPASRIPAPTPKRRIRQFPANFSNTLPVAAPLPRTALLRADTRASPRVILNLPQARHTSPRRLVMPTTAGGVAFIGVPFPPYSKAPHSPAHRHANFSNMLSSAFADGPSPHRHSRSAMKLSQSFRVHGIAPSRTTPKHRMRQPTANFSNTLSAAPRFADSSSPHRHTRRAMGSH